MSEFDVSIINASIFIEQRPPLQNRNDWLDEVWCEGGAVLDEDKQALLWFGEDNNTLLTVREHGQTFVARVYGDEEALRVGPSQVTTLRGLAWEPALVWIGDMPAGGLHLDLDDQTLYYWRANPSAGIEDRVRRRSLLGRKRYRQAKGPRLARVPVADYLSMKGGAYGNNC